MQEVALRLLVLLAGLPALDANDPEDKDSPFYYDWYGLRVGGLIFAGILCAMGIIVLMSGKCKCKFRQKPRLRPKLLRMDQLQGPLFPQVLALQGSLNSQMEFSTPSSNRLARA
uniref:Uncharacterized protein n=2 Tax=Ovis TaxID=9935 RepID=A0AC11DJ54_SHEEP